MLCIITSYDCRQSPVTLIFENFFSQEHKRNAPLVHDNKGVLPRCVDAPNSQWKHEPAHNTRTRQVHDRLLRLFVYISISQI